MALLLSLIFLYYAYALSMAAKLKVDGVEVRPGKPYDGPTILIVLFSIITASFSLSFVS
jgi:hypothetical protein